MINSTDTFKEVIENIIYSKSLPYPYHRTTLLEAFYMMDREDSHSDFIAWILKEVRTINNQNKISDSGFILLNHIINDLNLPKELLNNKPISIIRERSEGDGRVDIFIEWEGFILMIENKIFSPEGVSQCRRYLDEHRQSGKALMLIYLTPTGREPKSINEINKNELITLSYDNLLDYLVQTQNSIEKIIENSNSTLKNGEYTENEKVSRIVLENMKQKKIYVEDYILANSRRLGKGERMTETIPIEMIKINDSTNILFEHYDDLEKKKAIAVEDTNKIIDQIEKNITEKLDAEWQFDRINEGNRNYYWTKANWKKTIEDIEFSFGFYFVVGQKGKLLPDYNIEIGLFLHRLDYYIALVKVKNGDTDLNSYMKIRSALEVNLKDILRSCEGIDSSKTFNRPKSKNQHMWLTINNREKDFKDGVLAWADKFISNFMESVNILVPHIEKNIEKIWDI